MSLNSRPPKIVVAGSGYAGALIIKELVQSLGDSAEITLVDPKAAIFVHTVASARAVVDEEVARLSVMSLGPLMKSSSKGSVIRHLPNMVVESNALAKFVTLDDRTRVPYDYLVLCTGVSYQEPFRFTEGEVEVVKQEGEESSPWSTGHLKHPLDETLVLKRFAQYREGVAHASRVVVMGGGPAGINAACELRHAHPEKNILLVHAGHRLLHKDTRLTGRDSAAIMELLKQRNITVQLEKRWEPDGDGEKGDFVIPACGGAPNTSMLSREFRDARGYALCEPTLQLTNQDDIFCAGDIVAGSLDIVSVATSHAAGVAKNLALLIKGKKPKPVKVPKSKGILIVLGPDGNYATGMSAKMLAASKTKGMFIQEQRKLLKAK